MTNLKLQTCTPKQAQRLKELGVKQESLFYTSVEEEQTEIIYVNELIKVLEDGLLEKAQQKHSEADESGWFQYDKAELHTAALEMLQQLKEAKDSEIFSAFTAGELGVMMPCKAFTIPSQYSGTKKRCFHSMKWSPVMEKPVELDVPQPIDNEAEARAAILIAAIESGEVKVEEVNERLMAITVKE